MPANYVLLEKITVGAAGAVNVTFNNIPQTGYTDLVVKASTRIAASGFSTPGALYVSTNLASHSQRYILGDGGSATAGNTASISMFGTVPNTGYTANTFGSAEIYIPNYTSANYKPMSLESLSENNGTTAYAMLNAGLASATGAITSITLQSDANFVANSTFYLYGVAKFGTTPAIQAYATGGDIIETDGTYWYHAFLSSGTFTPTKGLSCDVLTVAGGGGGSGGGGGAGGVIAFAAQSLATTGYAVTIGAGGAGKALSGGFTNGNNGSNSQFASLTAAVGGGGGGGYNGQQGSSGGSGGGNGETSGTGASSPGGAGTSGQGNAGGSVTASFTGSPYPGAGGGGYGAAGNSPTSNSVAGAGGSGNNTVTNWGALSAVLTATGMGVSGYIAGGGGAGLYSAGGTGGSAGSGGGGVGASGSGTATSGTANTGSGGGGAGDSGTSGSGGSGLVIVRYAV